jgi:YD repeat-containing protein
MIKKMVFICLVVLLLQGFASRTARAQNANPNPCLRTTTWWTGDSIPPGWFPYSAYPGTYVYVIAAYKCPPPPECPCSSSVSPPMGSKPVIIATGDTFIEETDVAIPGLGGGLNLRRRWNSLWPANEIASSIGIFGPNWRSTYEERIFTGGDHYVKYSRGDGGYWASPANEAVLSQGASTWILSHKNGEQRRFSLATGLLTSILDRNGNTTQVSYDNSNRLTTVTDPAGRHLYFNYPNASSLLVSSVTSDLRC